jgi:LmbE family N-acetylglucosaminyl deacetylase
MPSVFIAPHCDDEALFGAFTLLRENPLVVVCFNGPDGIRADETRAGCRALGVDDVHFLGIDEHNPDPSALFNGLLQFSDFDKGYIPRWEEKGQRHHNMVSVAGALALKNATRYLTYSERGKSCDGREVRFELDWLRLKLIALACYRSQMARAETVEHFIRDQREYYV